MPHDGPGRKIFGRLPGTGSGIFPKILQGRVARRPDAHASERPRPQRRPCPLPPRPCVATGCGARGQGAGWAGVDVAAAPPYPARHPEPGDPADRTSSRGAPAAAPYASPRAASEGVGAVRRLCRKIFGKISGAGSGKLSEDLGRAGRRGSDAPTSEHLRPVRPTLSAPPRSAAARAVLGCGASGPAGGGTGRDRGRTRGGRRGGGARRAKGAGTGAAR